MAKIAWGRGFFRAWMLLAILWVVGAGMIGWGTVMAPYVRDIVVTAPNDPTKPAEIFFEFSDQHEALDDAVKSGIAVENPVRPDVTLFTAKTLPADQLTARLAEARVLVDDYYQRETTAKRSAAIPTALSAVFIPPLVLLLLGWAIGWVLSGFRKAA
ncbi:hypothetical protein ASD04_07200 [Devosia sp. Root436]|uniref:hypothetical protein n=1 Tax=Devosia sp. Root436 TaxID=1736537 RepID=UPI0006F72F54|nr:hypothetical protein [Devosia sp. Root436]KQX40405.1 hypothetical protein ASD04_07200 [Devosia sp. Root436]